MHTTKTTPPAFLFSVLGFAYAIARGAILIGALNTPAAFALDVNSPDVLGAYEGLATEAKLDNARAGVETLVDALRIAPKNGSGSGYDAAGLFDFSILHVTSCCSVSSGQLVRDAATDADLGAPGFALQLDNQTLQLLGSFSTDRAVNIGTLGATIDTGSLPGATYSLDIRGLITASGPLVVAGNGSVKVSANNIWSTAPFVSSGSLRGDTQSLNTDIGSTVSPPNIAPVPISGPAVEFQQTTNGVYAHVVSGGANFIKSGAGDLVFSNPNTYTGTTYIQEGRLILGTDGRINGGGLNLASGTTFDISQARATDNSAVGISAGVLSGSGQILLGTNTLGITAADSAPFTGQITGSGGVSITGDNPNRHFIFASAQNYLGTTRIDNATLALQGDGALSPNSVLSIGSNGVFDTVGVFARPIEVSSLDGSGQIVLGAQPLIFGRDPTTRKFSGEINGGSGITKIGSGTQILSGIGNYSGLTTVEGGVLVVTPQALGPIGPVVVNNAELEFTYAKANNPTLPIAAYSGPITGNGKVSKTGDGAVWLRGINTYTGGTEIRGGALIGNSASLQGNIAIQDSVAAFYQIDEGTYAGNTSGNGLLLKYGPGLLHLNGNNTHRGGTAFSGPLAISSDAALGASGGSVGIVDGTLAIEQSIASNRPFFFSGAAAIDTAGFNFDLSGGSSGAGALTKLGAGILTLNGTFAHTGTTHVGGGELRLLGTLAGGLSADTGARVSGNGIVGGNLQLSNNSIYAVNVNAAGGAERLTVNGGASVQGAALDIHASEGNYGARTRYTVLSATGGVTGEFANTTTHLAFLEPALRYNPNSVELTLVRNNTGFSDLANSPQQAQVGNILDALEATATGDMVKVIDAFKTLTAPEVGAALETVSGSSLTVITNALSTQSHAFTQQITTRLGSLQGATSVASFADEFDRGVLLAMNDGDGGNISSLYAAAALGAASVQPSASTAQSGVWLRGVGWYRQPRCHYHVGCGTASLRRVGWIRSYSEFDASIWCVSGLHPHGT